ncbi:MAG: LysR substrate-binding domain-containing protein [Pseudomonadota bacterium]
MARDLEIDLLRAMVAVAGNESFTQAAAFLGRTQSAVSMQIKRLEEIVGLRLFERTKKSVRITAEGETLLVYAHRMLRMNDEALSRLIAPDADGLVRLGAPDDYATCLLPSVLASFSKAHPLVRLEVICDNGIDLLKLLDDGKLDLVLATHPVTSIAGQVIRREPLHWVASPGFSHDETEPLPLILFSQGCVCREIALRALDSMDVPWRIAYSTRSIALIRNAVENRSGVTVMEASTIPAEFEILDGKNGFPALQDVVISLHRPGGDETPATVMAADHLTRELKTARV